MVDSRAKGRKAELDARNKLREWTGLGWERIPLSGALDAKHGLKGDLYIPGGKNVMCIEVKHYKEDQFTTKILTSVSPTFLQWWTQTVEQAKKVDKKPFLIFKHNRSKWFCAINYDEIEPDFKLTPKDIIHGVLYKNIFTCLLENFCKRFPEKLK